MLFNKILSCFSETIDWNHKSCSQEMWKGDKLNLQLYLAPKSHTPTHPHTKPKDQDITKTWTPETFQMSRVHCPERSGVDTSLPKMARFQGPPIKTSHTSTSAYLFPQPLKIPNLMQQDGFEVLLGLSSSQMPPSQSINLSPLQTQVFWVLAFQSVGHTNLGFGNTMTWKRLWRISFQQCTNEPIFVLAVPLLSIYLIIQ